MIQTPQQQHVDDAILQRRSIRAFLPDQIAIGKAYEAFTPDGALADEKQQARVKALGSSLAKHLSKLLA